MNICPYCNISFDNKRDLTYHLNKKHKDKMTIIDQKCENVNCNNIWKNKIWGTIVNGQKKYCCYSCKKEHSSIKYHANDNIECSKCGKILSSKYAFARHLTLNACKILNYCSKCNTKFNNERDYNYHLTIDCLNPDNKCKICGSHFNVINNHVFNKHKDIIQFINVKCQNINCNNFVKQEICGPYEKYHKKTCSDECLKEVQSQNSSKEKIYNCHICSDKYTNIKSLEKHMEKRHLNKDFQCKFCNATYNSKEKLHQHCKEKHINKRMLNMKKCKNLKCNNIIEFYTLGTLSFQKSDFCSKHCAAVYRGMMAAQKYTMPYEERYKRTLQHNGTCKWYTYIDKNNNKHRVQGTYELAYAKKMDELNEKFVTHPKGIKYNNNGRITYYFPDFYFPDKNLYVDTKAIYYLNLSGNKFDLLKTQHPEINIEIVTEKEFKNLGIDNIKNYIKNLIE